jgi:hypothetical protein
MALAGKMAVSYRQEGQGRGLIYLERRPSASSVQPNHKLNPFQIDCSCCDKITIKPEPVTRFRIAFLGVLLMVKHLE